MIGINWTEIRKGGDFVFRSCKLDYGFFQSVDFRAIQFYDCTLREADFSGANLSKVVFKNCDFSGSSLANVNIEKADFRGSRNYFIDPKLAKMKEAQFSFPEALVLIEALGVKLEM